MLCKAGDRPDRPSLIPPLWLAAAWNSVEAVKAPCWQGAGKGPLDSGVVRAREGQVGLVGNLACRDDWSRRLDERCKRWFFQPRIREYTMLRRAVTLLSLPHPHPAFLNSLPWAAFPPQTQSTPR